MSNYSTFSFANPAAWSAARHQKSLYVLLHKTGSLLQSFNEVIHILIKERHEGKSAFGFESKSLSKNLLKHSEAIQFSLPIRYLSTVYLLPIYFLCTAYPLFICCLSTAYLLAIHCLSDTHLLPNAYLLPIYGLSTALCVSNAYLRSIFCPRPVFGVCLSSNEYLPS